MTPGADPIGSGRYSGGDRGGKASEISVEWMKAAPVSVLVFLTGCTAAVAQTNPVTVRVLYEACKADIATKAPGYCLGFIVAVGESMANNGAAHYPHFSMCPAAGQEPSGGALVQSL